MDKIKNLILPDKNQILYADSQKGHPSDTTHPPHANDTHPGAQDDYTGRAGPMGTRTTDHTTNTASTQPIMSSKYADDNIAPDDVSTTAVKDGNLGDTTATSSKPDTMHPGPHQIDYTNVIDEKSSPAAPGNKYNDFPGKLNTDTVSQVPQGPSTTATQGASSSHVGRDAATAGALGAATSEVRRGSDGKHYTGPVHKSSILNALDPRVKEVHDQSGADTDAVYTAETAPRGTRPSVSLDESGLQPSTKHLDAPTKGYAAKVTGGTGTTALADGETDGSLGALSAPAGTFDGATRETTFAPPPTKGYAARVTGGTGTTALAQGHSYSDGSHLTTAGQLLEHKFTPEPKPEEFAREGEEGFNPKPLTGYAAKVTGGTGTTALADGSTQDVPQELLAPSTGPTSRRVSVQQEYNDKPTSGYASKVTGGTGTTALADGGYVADGHLTDIGASLEDKMRRASVNPDDE